MALSIEDRNFIKMRLPHGCQAEIADKLGLSRTAITLYLTGKNNSSRIEKAVVEKYSQVKNEQKELRMRIYE